MAATPFLLESNNIKWNPLSQTSFPTKPTNNLLIKLCSSKTSTGFSKPLSSKLRLSCTFMNRPQKPFIVEEEDEVVKNPFEAIVARTTMQVLKALKKPAIAVLLLGLLLLWYANISAALAASGGVMDGDSFDSSGSYSSSSYSTHDGYDSYTVSKNDGSDKVSVCVVVAFVLLGTFFDDVYGKTSVLKLQVGLSGTAGSLQRDLNRIAKTADTSSSKGYRYVLTETLLALIEHLDYCRSCYSSVDVNLGRFEGAKRFKQLSIEERRKFDEETLVNVNNIRKQRSSSQRAKEVKNEYIVITILVAVEGEFKLPTINGSGDFKEALQKLAAIPPRGTRAVKVLWTPQDENDTLTEQEFLEDYSLLRPL